MTERDVCTISKRSRLAGVLLSAAALVVLAPGLSADETIKVTLAVGGLIGNGESNLAPGAGITASGRVVAYSSTSSDLVPGDGNGVSDAFVWQAKGGYPRRISIGPDGVEGDGASTEVALSASGKRAAFTSAAANLVEGDGNGSTDVFVHEISSGLTRLVSMSSAVEVGNGASHQPSISANGRWTAFASDASNLVAGDLNGTSDIFVHDLKTGSTSRVSVSSAGAEGDGPSTRPAISGNGRYVAFESDATSLVQGDLNVMTDVFLHDLKTGATTRISTSTAGVEADNNCFQASIDGSGRRVAFASAAATLVPLDTNAIFDIFVRDTKTGMTTRESVNSAGHEANFPGSSLLPALSANGRYVAFRSGATNMVESDTNDADDIFLRDMKKGTTIRVSQGKDGQEGDVDSTTAALSKSGRYVAMASYATTFAAGDIINGDIFVRDTVSGGMALISRSAPGCEIANDCSAPSMSADGRYVGFVSHSKNLVKPAAATDGSVYLHDLKKSKTELVSLSSTGEEGNSFSFFCAVSANGRFVAFDSKATNLVPGDTNANFDVFLRDRSLKSTTRLSVSTAGDEALGGITNSPSMSADGAFVVFTSSATNLVPSDLNGVSDVFLRDVNAGTTTRVSVSSTGVEGDLSSSRPTISADGGTIAFTSNATTLVADDTNGTSDVFVYERATGQTTRVSIDSAGTQSAGGSYWKVALSGDGQLVAFITTASDLVADDLNGKDDVFVHDRVTGETRRVSLSSEGAEANDHCDLVAISADGSAIVFGSDATNLVADDTNGFQDIFLHDLATGQTRRLTVGPGGVQADGDSFDPSIDSSGKHIAFKSKATTLAFPDSSSNSDIFVRVISDP